MRINDEKRYEIRNIKGMYVRIVFVNVKNVYFFIVYLVAESQQATEHVTY